MSNFARKMSKGKAILARIEDLENGLQSLMEGLEAVLGKRDNSFRSLDEIVRAVVDILGEDKVVEAINASRAAKAEGAAKAAFDALEASKANGVAVAVDVISDKSILVVEQYNADGTPDVPAKVPVAVSSAPELFADGFGKGIGTRIERENGYLIVTEIYNIDEVRVTQVEAESLEKAAQETAEITGADAQ
jgi:CRISPR/Cas system-associated exonuclease Cas4 (RecB family)